MRIAGTWRRIREWLPLVVGLSLFLLLTLFGPSGFLLYFAVPVVAIWAIGNVVTMIRHPAGLGIRAVRLAAWIAALAIVASVHAHRAQAARRHAEAAIARLEGWHAANGRWPAKLAEIGEPLLKSDPLGLMYGVEKGEPFLVYRSTFVPFGSYTYDFPTRQWRFVD